MKKIFFLNFLAIFSTFRLANTIECNFMDVEVGMYGCEVLKDLYNQTTDMITGDHSAGKTDEDVKALFINAKSDYEFSPLYCRTFQNLIRIHIERVETAKRDDFRYCKKAQHLLIVGTDLWWLPEDVFTPMEDLRVVEISMNKIVYVPRDLIANNRRLEKFIFQDNKIQVVDLEFPSSLKEVSLEANPCIDRRVPSREARTVQEFNRIVSQKCGSSTSKRVKELEWKISEKRMDLDVDSSAMQSFDAETYKNWFIFLSCMCALLLVGWIATIFVLMKKINEISQGDQHYLVSMDANARREFLEE